MRALVSEGIGTGLLVAAVVGSGIMGERLSGGNMALALLANSIATGAILVTLIFTFGPLSGAHFNPAVSVAAYITAAYWFTSSTSFANPAVTIARGLTDTFSGIEPAGVPGFIAAQLLGAPAATLLFRSIVNPNGGGSA